jgi:hypothetical protein
MNLEKINLHHYSKSHIVNPILLFIPLKKNNKNWHAEAESAVTSPVIGSTTCDGRWCGIVMMWQLSGYGTELHSVIRLLPSRYLFIYCESVSIKGEGFYFSNWVMRNC